MSTGSHYHVSVLTAPGGTLLWHGSTPSWTEVVKVCAEAHRRRPHAYIFVRAPEDGGQRWTYTEPCAGQPLFVEAE